jgi:hypothetical protein
MGQQPIDSSELNSYFYQLADASKPLNELNSLPSELRRACGPWISVTAAAAKAAFTMTAVKAGASLVDLAIALSGVGDAQAELLKSIKADTLLLRQQPLHTAATLMAEAKRVGPDDQRWSQFLERAVDCLYQADSLSASSEERAVAQFGLACTYLTLDRRTDARHWIEESVTSERTALAEFIRKCQGLVSRDIAEAEEIEPEEPDSVGGFIKLALRYYYSDKRDRVKRLANEAKELVVEKHVEATRRFLPFANATEICASAICGRREAVILELSYYGVRYYLRETPISLPPHNLIHLEGEQT